MKPRLMRFSSKDFLYRATSGEVFRITRQPHGAPLFTSSYFIDDGNGSRLRNVGHSQQHAIELCEEHAHGVKPHGN